MRAKKREIHLEHPPAPSFFSEILIILTLYYFYQASPERSTRTQQKEFQTYVLDGVMDHLLAADVLLGNIAKFHYQSIDLSKRFSLFNFFFITVLFGYNLIVFIFFPLPFPFLWCVNGVAVLACSLTSLTVSKLWNRLFKKTYTAWVFWICKPDKLQSHQKELKLDLASCLLSFLPW